MPDSLHEMATFVRVVGAGSLSGAARDLGISPAMVSRTLASLEARLGVRLIHRTTRRLHLTDEGAAYHDACVRILGEVDEADAAASAGRGVPQGTLRVAMPASFGHRQIAPLVPRFAEQCPKVQLALHLSDAPVNLLEEGYDLAIRIAELEDSSLAARKLAPNRRVVCASPAYLARHGTPYRPEDLARHNCLVPTWEHGFSMTWEYKDPQGRPGAVRVSGHYACDNWEVLREWAVAGLGVALKSTWDVRDHLEDGSLVPLCAGYVFDTDVAIYAVYPHRRYLAAKTRAFIDFLAQSFGPEPSWDLPAAGSRAPSSSSAQRPLKPRIKGRARR
ncbi:MAG TPA: LysR family transcriptional regulator [Burkholderiales bacterium]|nr:LysR family transcriptional regulator [Burkholderiales bacterium]